MKDETISILKMVEEGKITAEEADKLIEALKTEPKKKAAGRYFRLMVVNTQEGEKVNLRIPLGIAGFFMRHIPHQARKALHDEGIDIEAFSEGLPTFIEEGKLGEILDVETEDGTKVKIWVE